MLFRSEVVDYIAINGGQGQVLLRSPKLFWFFSLLACIFSIALLALLFKGQHTQNARAAGQLVWDRAMITILSPSSGMIRHIAKKESSQAQADELLLSLQTSTGEQAIRLPQAGNLAMLMIKPGQQVEAGQVLAQLIPEQARLQAEFRVPASSLPYLQPGKKLALRIDAFPYQKFGMFEGVISEIAGVASADATGEKKYRIVVQMPQQSTRYFGKTVAFRADMAVDTDLPLYQHSLIESMFEPLLAMKGKI